MAAMGICLLVPGLIIDRLLYTLMLLTAGFALGVNNVKFITLFQNTVPSRKKGRFFALMQAVITASFPISYFVFGMLADYMTPPKICLIQGFGIILVAVFFLSLVKEEEQAFKDMPAPDPMLHCPPPSAKDRFTARPDHLRGFANIDAEEDETGRKRLNDR